MNKEQILEWLKQKEMEAYEKANQQYEYELALHDAEIYEKLEVEPTAQKIEESLQNAYKIYQEWIQKHHNLPELNIYLQMHCGLGYHLDKILNMGIIASLKKEILDKTQDVIDLRKKFKVIQDEISINYKKLIQNTMDFSDGDSMFNYLSQVGFDVSEITALKEDSKITAEVNPHFLFVNGLSEFKQDKVTN